MNEQCHSLRHSLLLYRGVLGEVVTVAPKTGAFWLYPIGYLSAGFSKKKIIECGGESPVKGMNSINLTDKF